MVKYSIIGVFLLLSTSVLAFDKLERINYNWELNPKSSNFESNDTVVSFVYLKKYQSIELIETEEGFKEYVLIHNRAKLLTDRGIEAFNKVYLPVYNEDKFLIEKARVINSNGEIIVLNESDIKEGVDEDSQRKYRYFAFEGIDINSEIEYIYMYKRNPELTGQLVDIQGNYEMNDFSFEIISPRALLFKFKTYNTDLVVDFDTTLIESKVKNRWFLDISKVEALPKQRTSAYSAELMFFGYKLSENNYNNSSDLFSYGELSKRIYSNLYESFSKNDIQFIKKLSKKIEIEKNASEFTKIRTIENFVKSNNRIISGSIQTGVTLEELWDAKILNEALATSVLLKLFEYHEVNCQPGLTSNRFDYRFDGDFELWRYADEYVLFFPDINEYTTPENFDRLGQMNYEYMYNDGLFIKVVELNGEKFGVGYVDFIPKNDYKKSGDTLVVNVDLKQQSFMDVSFDVYHSVNGYKAEYIQPYFHEISDEEDKKMLQESLINFLDADGKVEELEILNLTINDYGLNPVRSTGKLISNKFFEKARDNYLFKVGELIGPQSEMYSDVERKLPVEEFYTRHYDRTIKFNVPEGYSVSKLEGLTIHQFYDDEKGNRLMEFKSEYEQNGDEVIVHIIEYYTEVRYSLAIYKDYQRVINAAADFNKVVVVFEKL